ncbi:hypothetical protein D3C76_1090030 [compost metagenome]
MLEPIDHFFKGAITAEDTRREIVILDFHQFDNFTPAAHRELQQLITRHLGYRMISYDLRDKALVYLWLNHPGKNVVVAYNWGTDGYAFWDGVNQRWSGSDLNYTSALKQFMDRVAQEKNPSHELRSIQCAKYILPFHVPDDFSDKIDEWFKSEDENSYIQRFFHHQYRLVAAKRHRAQLHPCQPDQGTQQISAHRAINGGLSGPDVQYG